ncbi:MAG: cyanophycinase [Planctomycetota bacterium]
MIHGGKNLTTSAANAFYRLAGGVNARLVLIPTASEEVDEKKRRSILAEWRDRGFNQIDILHTRSRREANTPAFVRPLTEATAVWISGGQQYRLSDAYTDTLVEDELHALLERGGVIGGSSAGAAIVSRDMIVGGIRSPKMGRGLGLLPGVIVDQHFTERQRQNRLWEALDSHPGRFGLGIDEGATVIVRGRLLSVMGKATASVFLASSSTRDRRVIRLSAGGRHDLVALRRAAIARAGSTYPPASLPSPYVPQGKLIIVGGGGVEGILERFIDEAGGADKARIVVVPAAKGEPASSDPNAADIMKNAGVKDVRIVHTTLPDVPDTPANLEALRRATGIWFTGGRQWRIVDVFEGTQCLTEMRNLLRRGGVIAGSSAGATIQGDYLVRGSPLGNQIMMAEGYERGFAFLPGVAIDQHFTQRNRLADLQGVKERFDQLLCIGIDEATAVVVEGGTMEVIGRHRVAVYDKPLPMDNGDPPFTPLYPGDRYNFFTGNVTRDTHSAIGDQ